MDLTYDQVTAGQDSDTVAVTFIHSRGAAQDVVLKVGARLVGLTALTNTPVNLAETFPDGSQRGGLSRNVVNDPRTTFPLIARGQLLLKSNVASGQQVSGSFNVTFVNGIDPACGRTVFADFKASVP